MDTQNTEQAELIHRRDSLARQSLQNSYEAIRKTADGSAVRELVLADLRKAMRNMDMLLEVEAMRLPNEGPIMSTCEHCGRDRSDEACSHIRKDFFREVSNDRFSQ